jgi:hypothetical protein
MLSRIDECRFQTPVYAVTSAQRDSCGQTTAQLQAISLSFGEKSTIIHVDRLVLRVNDSGGLTMKVVAGSLGNDAIGPRNSVVRGGMVWPEEWGPPKAGSVHIDGDVLVPRGGLRVVNVTVRNPSRPGIVA